MSQMLRTYVFSSKSFDFVQEVSAIETSIDSETGNTAKVLCSKQVSGTIGADQDTFSKRRVFYRSSSFMEGI